jgi:DNA polymerase-1
MPRLRLLPEVTTVYSDQQAAAVLEHLMRRGGPIAIDTETTGLDVMRSRVLFWSMATETHRYFLPYHYLWFFEKLFRRKDIIWFLANAKYDMHILTNMGCTLRGTVYDIIVMDAMEDDTRKHGLKEQAKLAYGVGWGEFKDLFLNPEYVAGLLGKDKKGFSKFKDMGVGDKLLWVYDEAPETVEDYASCDAYFTYLRGMDLLLILQALPLATDMAPGFSTLYDYFTLIEAPFTKVLWKIERCGMPIDMERVKAIDGPMRDGLRDQEQVIRKIAGPTFNPGSRDEVADLLFTKQGFNLSPVSYTSTGKPSTAEKDLKLLLNRVKDQRAFDFLEAQLKRSHLTKLHGTFVRDIEKKLGPDGRIHCKLNQAESRTGRLTSSDPNLQNIPIRNDEFHIRSMFVAPKGMKLLDADYPQIQPRLAAVFAGEEKMLEAIRKGWDMHSANAMNMYLRKNANATYENIDAAKAAKELREKLGRALTTLEKELLRLRDNAKTVGLGVLFGEGPQKMALQLRITVDEAKLLISDFFETNPNIKRLIDEAHALAHEHECAWTMLGRYRRLHQINNAYNYGAIASEERKAFNHGIQGSEVEIMKLAMLRIDACPEWHALGGELCMTVHDELMGFAPDEFADDCLELMCALMADPMQWGPISLRLPISIAPDGGMGSNWTEAH